VPAVISHCANIFGERQHEEKYIPKLVKTILAGETVTIHTDEKGRSGSRMYVYAEDVARAIYLMLECGEVRQKYNIPGVEISNEDMAYLVAEILGKKLNCTKSYPFAERPGWDFRYSIMSRHLFELGWEPNPDFKALLRKVIENR
jgi:dTDP-glucose 4,6-dehydratase